MNEQADRIFHIVGIIWTIVTFAGLVFALGIGLWPVRRDRLTTYAVAAGILVNLPGCLAGGPELFAGMIFFPIIFILVAHLGRGIRWILVRMGLLATKGQGGSQTIDGAGQA